MRRSRTPDTTIAKFVSWRSACAGSYVLLDSSMRPNKGSSTTNAFSFLFETNLQTLHGVATGSSSKQQRQQDGCDTVQSRLNFKTGVPLVGPAALLYYGTTVA